MPLGVGRGRGGWERPEEIGGSKLLALDKDGGDVGIDLLLG